MTKITTHRDEDGHFCVTYSTPDQPKAEAVRRLLSTARAGELFATLIADLELAAKTLREYEALHRAKGTEDSTKKAERNADLASRFEATLATAVAN